MNGLFFRCLPKCILQLVKVQFMFYFLFSCSGQPIKNSDQGYGARKKAIVSMEIPNKDGIKKIQFISNNGNVTVPSSELLTKRILQYGFNVQGEGTITVVVFTATDTVSSQHYVERGYHVKLKYATRKISVIDPIGY